MRPFSDNDTSATFRGLQERISGEIEGLSNDYVLKASPSELEEHFIQKGSINPLVLHPDDYYISSQIAKQVDVSNDFLRGAYGDGRPIVVAGTLLKVAIPFEGDPALWRLRASTFSMGGYPDVELGNGTITVVHTFADDSVSPEALKIEIDRSVQSLVTAVGFLANDVSAHNASIRQIVPGALERKRQKALGATGAIAALGIPMKRSDKPPTYAVPTRRRPSPLDRPAVATEKYEPEPVLDAKKYAHILKIMRSMVLVIERNPTSFKTLDEEAIRDHFLIQLNGHYEGAATSETFNAAGKTDILIRADNRNVFIAECKFWRGPKQFNAAIDQLLGYLTWRDTKAALLVFNKNRDSVTVRDKMHEAIETRPEWRKTMSRDPEGDAVYVLVKDSDPGREIALTTQLYDVPNSESAASD